MLRLCLAFSYLARTARSFILNTLEWRVSICRACGRYISDRIEILINVCARGSSVVGVGADR
jgi:hypothetical protein